jgi:hypothetical protein
MQRFRQRLFVTHTNSPQLWINNDNDGLDDNSGESMLLSIDNANYTKPVDGNKCIRRRH